MEAYDVARVEGVDPKQTSFLMRRVFKKVRKVLGRDLTPQKITARVPRVFWAFTLPEWFLGQKAKIPQRRRSIIMLRTARRAWGARFESTPILPVAEYSG